MREMENVDKRTTAMYRSPELADVEGTAMFGAGELTEAVDVWAMGCVLYTMAFFKPPFPPEGLRTERYAIPEGSKYSAGVHALIKRMLTADVEVRATIDHVMECIDEMMEGRPIPPLQGSGAAPAKKAAAPATSTTTSSGAAAAPTRGTASTTNTTEARKEALAVAKPAMDLLDMDFNPSTSSGSGTASKAPTSADVWNAAPATTGASDGFANFASFPSPTAGATGDGKRMDVFGFPASPEKPKPAPPAFGCAAPMPATTPPAAPVDPFADLAPAMGAGHAPRMGAAPGFTAGFHHQPPPQQLYGQQPQGFYPPQQQQQQQHQAQGFYQPHQQQMWGAQQQQQQQQAFGGAFTFNGNRF
ncbi:hypothetical protein PybrP1_010024 [[Pythium] brassicae (nom. inval.)]|nr:hypothetical protein PybrP1_010024 [[Pythium] brassicae (nom. inval.)]